MYSLPKTIKKEILIMPGITLADVAIILGMFMAAFVLGSLVYMPLRPFYYVYFATLGFYLSRQSKDNPKKRKYQTIILMLRCNHNTYHSI